MVRGSAHAVLGRDVSLAKSRGVFGREMMRPDSEPAIRTETVLLKLFGLTGGVGMGKSVSASLLAARGVPVIDTDVIAREIVQPGEPALKEIAEVFGREFIDDDGALRRG